VPGSSVDLGEKKKWKTKKAGVAPPISSTFSYSGEALSGSGGDGTVTMVMADGTDGEVREVEVCEGGGVGLWGVGGGWAGGIGCLFQSPLGEIGGLKGDLMREWGRGGGNIYYYIYNNYMHTYTYIIYVCIHIHI
jgi:hypothetical protein